MPSAPSSIHINLGPRLPVDISPDAQALIETAPGHAVKSMISALKRWVAESPVHAARVRVLPEPEEPSWAELVVELKLDLEDDTEALNVWDELGAMLDKVRCALPEAERTWLERHFAVHLSWGADPWDDEPDVL